MVRHFKYIVLLLLLVPCAQAKMVQGNGSYWQCSTKDNSQTVWTATSTFQKVAINLAFASCKKQSKSPNSCKTSMGRCEAFVNGLSTKPLWRCTAVDREAAAWKSNYYSKRLDAALAAQAYCKDKSDVPGTCYVNMVTCYNINEVF